MSSPALEKYSYLKYITRSGKQEKATEYRHKKEKKGDTERHIYDEGRIDGNQGDNVAEIA